MKQKINLAGFAFFLMALAPFALGVENDYFPLIEGSTYTYHGIFNGKNGVVTSDVTMVVKSGKRDDVEYFYFINPKDERDPNANIGVHGIGRGLYRNQDGNIGVIECLLKSAIALTPLKDWAVILKSAPEFGQNVERKPPGGMTTTWKVEGFEDVTVPAGTFKQCLKIRTEEIVPERKRPEWRMPNGDIQPAKIEPEQRSSGYAWLAKGVGMVKWQRHTGRVDELTAYKIAEPKGK